MNTPFLSPLPSLSHLQANSSVASYIYLLNVWHIGVRMHFHPLPDARSNCLVILFLVQLKVAQ